MITVAFRSSKAITLPSPARIRVNNDSNRSNGDSRRVSGVIFILIIVSYTGVAS